MKAGIELVAQERTEQIEKHGRTVEKDVIENRDFQLSDGASVLMCVGTDEDLDPNEYAPKGWDIDLFFRMMSKPYKERLIIAGALICAEIDRLQAEEELNNPKN